MLISFSQLILAMVSNRHGALLSTTKMRRASTLAGEICLPLS